MTWADDMWAGALAMAEVIVAAREKKREAVRLRRNERARLRYRSNPPVRKPAVAVPAEFEGPLESCICWKGHPPCSFCTSGDQP